jgi:hypothetical protein
MTSVTLDPIMKIIFSILLVCLCLDCFGQAQLGITNRFAFPSLAGVRLREANITDGTNDSGNAALYGVPANYYDQDYYWNSTGPSGNEWTQWLVPQVLAAKAAGANCIRMMWSADAFIGDSTHHGAAAWLGTNTYSGLTNEIGMMATLCMSNGMWLYPSCTESRVLNDGNIPTNMIALYISNFCAQAVCYPNVPAIDVVQEADGTAGGTNGFMAQDCFQWIASARAGMAVTGRRVPVTCSLNGAVQTSDLNLVNRWQAYNLAAAGVDYLDIHAYYQYYNSDFVQAVTNRWNLPVVFGETGINISAVWGSGPDNETTYPFSSEKRQDFFFTAAQAAAELPYFQLEGVWAIAPNWDTNEEDFGLYSGAQAPSTYQFTQSRDQLRNFALFPTNVQPANYQWSICCTGVNTSVLNYSSGTRYAVGSGMLDVSGNPVNYGHGIWQRQNNLVQDLGETSSASPIVNGAAVLWQTTLPNAQGQYIQFDIPPQSPALYNSEYCTWEVYMRGQANGNGYIISLTSDNGHTYDNKIDVQSCIGGVITDLGNTTYATALNLAQWWRVTVNVSTNINPTTITCTVSNMTTGTVMTPSLVVSDSTASLQAPGGLGLLGYFGQPYFTNINFSTVFDVAPTVATPPAGTPTGANVALTWSAATGGSGTVNYTPQYNVSAPFGFPSTTTWTNGTPVSGLSETVSGLPANTNVIFRVMSADAMSATNYSPWQIVTTGSAGAMTYIPFTQ